MAYVCRLQIFKESISKYCYPLPRIDQLIDATARMDALSMMDTFQGYHHIPVAVEDKKKIYFISPLSTFASNVIPFGLKNAKATYDGMVD